MLELGAGAGLPGLVAARCGAAEVLLTDGDARAVKLLEKNIAANPSECPVEAAVLAYGAAPPPPSDPKLADRDPRRRRAVRASTARPSGTH